VFSAPSRPPFASPDDYHRFHAPATPSATGSGGIGAGGVGADIEERVIIRTPVRYFCSTRSS
jgi:transcription factor E2F3